nr:MAG TPA: hypothetical protein [Caudoviricetes sp.]
MVTKKKVTKITVSKEIANANDKSNENKSLEEFIDDTPLEEDLKEISKVVEEVKKEDEKNHNFFQTMKNIIWF